MSTKTGAGTPTLRERVAQEAYGPGEMDAPWDEGMLEYWETTEPWVREMYLALADRILAALRASETTTLPDVRRLCEAAKADFVAMQSGAELSGPDAAWWTGGANALADKILAATSRREEVRHPVPGVYQNVIPAGCTDPESLDNTIGPATPAVTSWIMCGCETMLDGVALTGDGGRISPDGMAFIAARGWEWNGIGWDCPACTRR